MSERISLTELIERVRVEAGISTNAAHGIQQRPHIIGLLNRVQRDVAAETDWDELDIHEVVPTEIGVWVYDLPNTMAFEKVRDMKARDGTSLHRIKKGFGPTEFASIDPAVTNSWPIRRWRIDPTSQSAFEVWPNPDRVASIDILGQRVVARMVEDDDFCTLDADVLALRVAGNLLAKANPQEAQLKLADATKKLLALRSDQSSNKGEDIVLGGGLRRQHVDPGLD